MAHTQLDTRLKRLEAGQNRAWQFERMTVEEIDAELVKGDSVFLQAFEAWFWSLSMVAQHRLTGAPIVLPHYEPGESRYL